MLGPNISVICSMLRDGVGVLLGFGGIICARAFYKRRRVRWGGIVKEKQRGVSGGWVGVQGEGEGG